MDLSADGTDVNSGREKFESMRKDWNTPTVSGKTGKAGGKKARKWKTRELYDVLKDPHYRPFPRKVPLEQLVDVLIDVWESVCCRLNP